MALFSHLSCSRGAIPWLGRWLPCHEHFPVQRTDFCKISVTGNHSRGHWRLLFSHGAHREAGSWPPPHRDAGCRPFLLRGGLLWLRGPPFHSLHPCKCDPPGGHSLELPTSHTSAHGSPGSDPTPCLEPWGQARPGWHVSPGRDGGLRGSSCHSLNI